MSRNMKVKPLQGRRAATKETRKLLLRQIDKALGDLEGQRTSNEAIHQSRKRIKMARATLRLLRSQLPKEQYRAGNSRLREAAKPLSEARDTFVLQHTFAGLSHANLAAPLKKQLSQERARANHNIVTRNGLPHARQLLQDARDQVSRWRVGRKGWSVVGTGLKRVYAQGRDAFESVQKTPSDAAFHEWRKQVKYLHHQLQLVQPIKPGKLGTLADRLHRLSNELGDDHDLAVLRAKLHESLQHSDHPEDGQTLGAKINVERALLQHKALRLGLRIYDERPKHFGRRLHKYWRKWDG